MPPKGAVSIGMDHGGPRRIGLTRRSEAVGFRGAQHRVAQSSLLRIELDLEAVELLLVAHPLEAHVLKGILPASPLIGGLLQAPDQPLVLGNEAAVDTRGDRLVVHPAGACA